MLPTTFNTSMSLSASGTSSTAGTASIQVMNPGSGNAVSNTLQVQVGNSTPDVTATAAARLLEQSTFGPTPALIQHVQQVGLQAFLNEQYAATSSTYTTPTSTQDISVVKQRFFTNALTGQDQLRQHVAWALAQIFVVSNQRGYAPSGRHHLSRPHGCAAEHLQPSECRTVYLATTHTASCDQQSQSGLRSARGSCL